MKRSQISWAKYGGYEVTTRGDRRFSALTAQLEDGYTIESHYQLLVKGYGQLGDDWRLGKGKPPLDPTVDLWGEYKALWVRWSRLNPELMTELRQLAKQHGNVLSDRFANTPVNQARALAEILNET